jgi:hypothetical protein
MPGQTPDGKFKGADLFELAFREVPRGHGQFVEVG